MPTTTPVNGKGLPLKVHNTATTVTIINLTSNGFSVSRDTRDVTSKDSGTFREYRHQFADATLSFEGLYTALDNAMSYKDLMAYLTAGTEIFYEIGTGVTGEEKITGKGIITSLELDSPMDDNVTFSGEIQNTGDPTFGTY